MAKITMERTEHDLITGGVKKHEQTLSAGKPFWTVMVGNIGLGSWLMGVIIAGMGLDFTDALFVLVLGGLTGSVLPSAVALLGPATRLSQMELGRLALGRTGKKIPAFLNWVGAIGWDVLNNVLSAAALIALCTYFGFQIPLWASLGILVGIQLVIGVYGHHMIQETSKYTGALMGLFFIVIGVIAMHATKDVALASHATSSKDVFLAFILLVAYNIGSTPYMSDYTRYLPSQTPRKFVFLPICAALFVSLFIPAFFGYMSASVVTEQTPEGVMKAFEELSGRFAPLVLFFVAFNSIPSNAVNDNSAAYSLMSAGIKLSRPKSAIIGAVLGYIVCLFASSSFIDFFENFLFLFAHWIAPWASILLVHWFVVHKTERRTPSGVTLGCWILMSVAGISILLFSANSLYTGMLSETLGGIDIGPYIGFVAAGTLYYGAFRLWPAKFKTVRT